MSRTSHGALLVLGTLLSCTAASAQRDTTMRIDPRWRAYLGCWSTSAAGAPGPDVCLLPTRDRNTVELVTVIGDSIVPATMLTASGDRVSRTKDGCTGWELSRWSDDDRRLYIESEYNCGGGAPQRVTGMFAHNGDSFSQIESVKARSTTAVRAVRFDLLSDSLGLPPAILRRLPMAGNMWAARAMAAAEVTTADVLEVSRAVGAPVTEAWLAERGQKFVLNARELRNLRDARIPTSVIDMMVAVSNPGVFAVMQNQPGMRRPQLDQRGLTSAEELALAQAGYRGRINGMPLGYDPFFGFDNAYFPYWGFSQFGRFGQFNQFGYFNQIGQFGGGWLNPYGFNGFQNGGGFIGGNGPYVIVPAPPISPPGRAVNGLGYTQGGNSGGDRRGAPTPSVQSGGGYSSGGGGGSGASSGGSGASSNGGGEQRTAKPRP
jgi:hypothetical protein